MCPQNTKLEEHPWRCLYLSAELAKSEYHVDDSGKVRDVCTFLQVLVNSQTQVCPWRFLYLSTELGEQ